MDLSDDLLDGANAIAAFTGLEVRRIYYMLERGHLPAFKIGDKWFARKSAILDQISKLECSDNQLAAGD